ncbi:unnamed protein product [Calypogeia fissa]
MGGNNREQHEPEQQGISLDNSGTMFACHAERTERRELARILQMCQGSVKAGEPALPVNRRRYGGLHCDEIQVPAPGPFSRAQLNWTNKQAWIPKTRLKDFLKGEECREGLNTCLKIKETVTRNTVIGLHTIRYWCAYGPKDARPAAREDLPEARVLPDGQVPLLQTTKTGASFRRRGCRYHFTANFQDLERPEACLLKFVVSRHVDRAGNICHGLKDLSAWDYAAHMAPRISIELRESIERLLRTGVTPLGVLKAQREELREHRKQVGNDKAKVVWTRDMGLNLQDIHNVQKAINKKKSHWASEDALGLKLWVEANGCQTLLYQQRNEDTETPFLHVFATPWQMEKMATLDHGSAVCMDATFGVNQYEYSLYTMLCFDEFQNGIPTCWALMETHKEVDVIKVLESIKIGVQRTREYDLGLDKTWAPACFIVDCAAEEQTALSTVWPEVPITLCIWHVRRAWFKNILKKVRDPFARATMNSELGDLMYKKEKDPLVMSIAFMLRWRLEQPLFVEYYETYWHSKITKWAVNFRKFNHANQTSNGAIERWHAILKLHLRHSKPSKVGRKVVWLVEQLVGELEHHYWCMSCLKWQGRVRNRKIEDIIWKAIVKARSIPTCDVKFGEDGNIAFVRSQKKPEEWHVVEGYETQSCVCTCGSSIQGNTCKHQIKLLRMGGMKEAKILHTYGTLYGTMMGGLAYERAKFPHEQPAPKVANVTLLLVATDSVAMTDQEKDASQEIEPTQDTEVGEKIFSYEEYQKVLSDIYVRAERVPNLVNRGMTELLKLRHDIYDAEARYSSVQQVPTPLVVNQSQSSFERIPGADGSMIRKLSFVDKMCRRGRTKRNAPKVAKGEKSIPLVPNQVVEPFVRTVKVKESDQQILDKAALKCIDLNEEPDWHFTATMGRYKKPTKLVSSQKHARNGNCTADGEQEADAQVAPGDGAQGANSVEGVLATPIVKKTARKGRGAKTALDGAQKPAKVKAPPRARKEKAPKVPKAKPAPKLPKAKPAPKLPKAKPTPRVPKVPKSKPALKKSVLRDVGNGAILELTQCNENANPNLAGPVNGGGGGDTDWTPPIPVVVDPAIQSTVLSNIYSGWLFKGVVEKECTKQSPYLGGLHSGLLEQFMKSS